jgi:hypothetical protein
MIAGRLPFEGTVSEVLAAQLEREPPPLKEIRPDVHADAARLVASAMSKDPANRPESAGVFGNMLAAQLEPATAFFRRVFRLFLERTGPLLGFGLAASAPLIVVSTLLALWQLAHVTLGLPAIGSGAATAALIALFALSLISQTAFAAMPMFALHALAAPLRPLDSRRLLRAYAPRLRRWARAVAPLTLALVGWMVVMAAFVWLVGVLAPWARQFSRPVRLAILLPLATLPFVGGIVALRRRGLGVRQMGFLGTILLIEDLPFEQAAKRSAELLENSGSIRNSIQKWYLVVIGATSMALGMYMGARGFRANPATLIPFTPVFSVLVMILLTFNSVVSSLLYLSARRAGGESLERVFADFEANALSPDRAHVARQTRLRERMVSPSRQR